MLKVACPYCKKEMKLNQPKAGKFSPRCRSCNQKFRLLIEQRPDSSFRFKAAVLDQSKRNENRRSDSNEATQLDSVKHNRAAETKPSIKEPDASQTPQLANRTTQKAQGQTVATTSSSARTSSVQSGKLGPYRLIKMLGEGGMGCVFLANQMSLDRDVALKVIRSRLASNPSMLARFTREAYAAAQLIHPNVVQIYDMGKDQGNSFFSMELVKGSSLHEVIRKKKKLDPEEATSYILHAARGLKCAHNAGMVHRDVKPANLLVNEDGLVKVADLGLVKVPDQEDSDSDGELSRSHEFSSQLTQAGSTIGTPYYMAPEQTRTSAVDHRADIYSLGCTFYVLLTGKRPFEGSSLEEVASKHTSEPLVPPSSIARRVPEELSAIVSQMMAKDPNDRYQNAEDLIDDLEGFLGIKSAGGFTPDESDAETIEKACETFNAPSLVKLRGVLPLGLIAGSILLAFLTFFASWRLATGLLMLPVFSGVAHLFIAGLNQESIVFRKLRELFFRSGIIAWAKWSFAVALVVLVSFLIGSFPHWLLMMIVGTGLGAAYYYLVDVPLKKTRAESVSRAQKLVRKMRVKGVDEATIQSFVAKYAGDHWEEFFENLFGYTAKREVRKELSRSETRKSKPKFRAWRDGIVDHIAQQLESRTNAVDRKHLQRLEHAGLVAEGLNDSEAKAQANQMAEAIVDHGDSIRIAQLEMKLRDANPAFRRLQQRNKIKSMLQEARSGQYRKERKLSDILSPVLNGLFGPYARFLAGSILLAGSLMWASENDLLVSMDQIKELGEQGASAIQQQVAGGAENTGDVSDAIKKQGEKILASSNRQTAPFMKIFNSFDSLIAGLVLVVSTIVFGWRVSLFAIPAAVVALLGTSLGIPDVSPMPIPNLNTTSSVIAILLLVVGIVFGKE